MLEMLMKSGWTIRHIHFLVLVAAKAMTKGGGGTELTKINLQIYQAERICLKCTGYKEEAHYVTRHHQVLLINMTKWAWTCDPDIKSGHLGLYPWKPQSPWQQVSPQACNTHDSDHLLINLSNLFYPLPREAFSYLFTNASTVTKVTGRFYCWWEQRVLSYESSTLKLSTYLHIA